MWSRLRPVGSLRWNMMKPYEIQNFVEKIRLWFGLGIHAVTSYDSHVCFSNRAESRILREKWSNARFSQKCLSDVTRPDEHHCHDLSWLVMTIRDLWILWLWPDYDLLWPTMTVSNIMTHSGHLGRWLWSAWLQTVVNVLEMRCYSTHANSHVHYSVKTFSSGSRGSAIYHRLLLLLVCNCSQFWTGHSCLPRPRISTISVKMFQSRWEFWWLFMFQESSILLREMLLFLYESEVVLALSLPPHTKIETNHLSLVLKSRHLSEGLVICWLHFWRWLQLHMTMTIS